MLIRRFAANFFKYSRIPMSGKKVLNDTCL